MKTVITSTPEAVAFRLEEIGLAAAPVQEIIDIMVDAKRSATANDVAGAGGTRAYLDGTRRDREVGAPFGWVKDSRGNLESMIHDENSMRLVVCNGDEDTGVVGGMASNRNPKGPATEQIVAENSEQFTFESLLEAAKSVSPKQIMELSRPDGFTTWYLFVYADADTYRAELSCPVSVQGGYLAESRERIILVRGGDDDNNLRPRVVAPEPDTGFEIIVTRKTA